MAKLHLILKGQLPFFVSAYYCTEKDDNIHKQRSSFAFCSLTDRPTDKIFVEQMLIYKRNVYLIQGRRKSRLPLNLTYIKTDRHTYRRTDISVYRVASLLINLTYIQNGHQRSQSSFATKNTLSNHQNRKPILQHKMSHGPSWWFPSSRRADPVYVKNHPLLHGIIFYPLVFFFYVQQMQWP